MYCYIVCQECNIDAWMQICDDKIMMISVVAYICLNHVNST